MNFEQLHAYRAVCVFLPLSGVASRRRFHLQAVASDGKKARLRVLLQDGNVWCVGQVEVSDFG